MTEPLNPALIPPGALGGPAAPARADRAKAPTGPSFADVLGQHATSVNFSGHAWQRIERRGIEVTPDTLQRLETAVDRAAGKGSRESVVLVDGTAFVVSVRNRTVITAVDRDHMREHVFTNIDSAVIG